jgi:hypothetical protein
MPPHQDLNRNNLKDIQTNEQQQPNGQPINIQNIAPVANIAHLPNMPIFQTTQTFAQSLNNQNNQPSATNGNSPHGI